LPDGKGNFIYSVLFSENVRRERVRMDIFEKNMAVLEKKNAEYVKQIRNIDIEDSQRITLRQTSDGTQILSVKWKERWWNLNSRLNPELAADIYWERYEIPIYGIYFIYGASDGRHIRKCMERCDNTNCIVVCEPDIEVLAVACHTFDFTDLFRDDRIYWYLPEVSEVKLQSILDTILDYSKTKLLEFCILPSYDVRFPDKCQRYMDSILEKIKVEHATRSTYIGFNRMIPRHTLFHMKNLIYHRNIAQMKQSLEEYDISRIPAVIVSAGPSLDKNVCELKKAQGKAFIIVVDAALRTVLRAGVRPDLIYTIDPESPDRFFENLELDGLLWACSRIVRPEVVKQYARKIFYNGFFWKKWNAQISEELGYLFPWLTVGGSVTSEAFQLAAYLGFKKMILVGQDMAFTNGVSHTSGIEKAFGDNDEYIQSRLLVDVEGYDGTMLKTDYQMYIYKCWFEKLFLANKDNYEVINATEGGARIEGARNVSLKETIEKECRDELDIYQIFQKIPEAFTKEQQERLCKTLKTMPQELEGFRKKLTHALEEQERLLEQMKQNGIKSDKLAGKLRKLIRLNEQIRQEPICDMVILYAEKEEYQVGEDVYKAELGPEELVQKSLQLLRGYQNGIRLLEEDIEEYILKD
jgi:hypothetical protein